MVDEKSGAKWAESEILIVGSAAIHNWKARVELLWPHFKSRRIKFVSFASTSESEFKEIWAEIFMLTFFWFTGDPLRLKKDKHQQKLKSSIEQLIIETSKLANYFCWNSKLSFWRCFPAHSEVVVISGERGVVLFDDEVGYFEYEQKLEGEEGDSGERERLSHPHLHPLVTLSEQRQQWRHTPHFYHSAHQRA